MKRISMITRLTRIAAISAAFGTAVPAVAADSIRVYVVKEKKGVITAPAARDAGVVLRSFAKRFGVEAPKGKTSVVQLDLPASVWEATKLDVARIVSKRGLSAVVADTDSNLGKGWATGLTFENRVSLATAQQVEVDLSLAGRDMEKLAREVLINQMNARIAGARSRHERGGLQGKPSEDKEGSVARLGKFDIDFGPGGGRIEIDCDDARNADELACQLSPNDGDSDPAPSDDEDGERDGLPFGPRDCDPFVDADCNGGDLCSLGVGPNHPLAGVLGCGFLDAVQDGAIGPRTNDADEPSYEVTWDSIEWDSEDMDCTGWDENTDMCMGSGSIIDEDDDKVCSTQCGSIVCFLTQTDDGEERVCSATLCDATECL